MNYPQLRGKDVDTHMFEDSDNTKDNASYRLRSGLLIYVDFTLVPWLSKKQSSLFGAMFLTMKQGIAALWSLRYKLMMMGVPMPGLSYINDVCYHVVHESVVSSKSLVQ